MLVNFAWLSIAEDSASVKCRRNKFLLSFLGADYLGGSDYFPTSDLTDRISALSSRMSNMQLLREKFDQCVQTARSHGYHIEVSFGGYWKGASAGVYKPKEKRVEINLGLAVKSKEHFDHILNDTIPHELSHAVQYQCTRGRGHDIYWKNIMRRVFGLEPVRCHSLDVEGVARRVARPYVYVCKCAEPIKVTRNIHEKMQKGQNRICVKCRVRISYKERENA